MLSDFKKWKPECPKCKKNDRIVRSSEAIMPGYWLCLNCHHYFKAKRISKFKRQSPKDFDLKETKQMNLN